MSEPEPIFIGNPDKPILQRSALDPFHNAVVVAIDMSGGVSKSVAALLRESSGSTVLEIIEMQRHADSLLDKAIARLNETITKKIEDIYLDSARCGQSWMQMYFDGEFKVKQVNPWRYHHPAQRPQWRPEMRRPQQRSAKMRKHRRIVLSRMTPNEARRKRAEWERFKTNVKTRDIINPNASKFWKDFF